MSVSKMYTVQLTDYEIGIIRMAFNTFHSVGSMFMSRKTLDAIHSVRRKLLDVRSK